MQPLYKVELYDRGMNFRSWAPIEAPTISFDYLTIEGIQITAPLLAVQKGDFAHITDYLGKVVYQGIVDDYEADKTLLISILPLLSLFDLTVTYDRRDLQSGALEDFIAGIITELYITGEDTLQHIPMSVVATSSTTNTALNIKSNVHEFYDIITKGFVMYGVVLSAVFLPQAKKIEVTVGKLQNPDIVLEAHLDNVLEKSFVIGDHYGQTNKILLINKYDEDERITYYLHPDGSIDTNNSDRITPVFAAAEYVESEEFADDAAARAKEKLTMQKYDNLIELLYARADPLVMPELIPIGSTAQIHNGNDVYQSILTGYELAEKTIRLTFGNVRLELTKKLILERRQAQ